MPVQLMHIDYDQKSIPSKFLVPEMMSADLPEEAKAAEPQLPPVSLSEPEVAPSNESQHSTPSTVESSMAEPNWQPLDARHLAMEMRASWIFWIGLVLVACMVSVLVGFGWGWTHWIFGLVASGFMFLIGLSLWSIVVIVPRSHHAAGWMLSDRGIEIRKGIWWRHLIVIPKQRIQHSDVRQGPLLRAYGLANLVIFTAGTENAQVELVGLSFETAQFVRDRLLEFSNVTHVSMGGV